MKIILDAPYRRNLTLTMHDREQIDRSHVNSTNEKSEECFDTSTRETGNGEMIREPTVQVVGGGGSAMFYISYIMHKTSRTWVISCLKYAVRISVSVYITTYGLRDVFLTIV